MIPLCPPTPGAPRWLRAFVLILAASLPPLGALRAQTPDYGAVGKRLAAAVEAGELSRAQADAMMVALKKAAAVRGVGRRVRAAVAAGEITVAQAEVMMAALEQRVASKTATATIDWAAIRRKLAAAVEAGTLTREQAAAKIAAMRRGAAAKPVAGRSDPPGRVSREDVDRARREIRAAVAAGKITAQQGREKLAYWQHRLGETASGERAGGERRAVTREGYERKAAALKAAVAAGRIPAEEAREHLRTMRRAIAAQRAGETRADGADRAERAERREAARRRLEAYRRRTGARERRD